MASPWKKKKCCVCEGPLHRRDTRQYGRCHRCVWALRWHAEVCGSYHGPHPVSPAHEARIERYAAMVAAGLPIAFDRRDVA